MQDLTDSDFDSESTDNESDLTDVTMPSQEIIRLLAQYCSKQKIWKKSEAKPILEYHIVWTIYLHLYIG